ncbi:bifunctional 5,10-methylenetetrahydrofolate dehydrogenase/5,10-methenyltetrahydrofolate cyclohydrolase [Phocicoccus pinnipedialis]|uniref:Bifunctional protein FolD n=1 Tax=Phocicoccus pinnipedialis TaxID=110845 RepID=A0A6V7R9Z3_9BACL|nr:bifunctional 5,10-methylenetetrahydrofolate dehydrogenase/5,10-methenyltetrahydrofolate cyclohydrolase [Jeotgalicoccus pinnipedialis]MBP1940198.1 methylenetetrahydrofolate dehydrogenase (NADP+)/methenyltetrahydrofolate cyclohydrolase [Jeotgalicoccus pinnipedialis]CAD2073973.1 Bifunctional protein FolD protein [Jeotgalicoccus pinnipedialis]
MAELLDGKKVAAHLSEQIKEAVQESKKIGISPKVCFVRVGDLEDSISYENAAMKRFEKLGIETMQLHFGEDISENEFLDKFKEVNWDVSVHGILLLQPLPKHIDITKASRVMRSHKDIDGLTVMNLGKVLTNATDRLEPCTPAAVMEMLDYYGVDLEGKNVTVVGASAVVGKPLSLLMLNKNATVTTCNLHTKDLVERCKNADVIVSCAGAINLIQEEHVKPGAIVVDVGINFNDEGKLVGDVDFENVVKKAGMITPVPGGIGAITTTVLAQHLMKAVEYQKEAVLFVPDKH